MPEPNLMAAGTVLKYIADLLQLRKNAKQKDKDETIRHYLEGCRRRDHEQLVTELSEARADIAALRAEEDTQLGDLHDLLSLLWDATEEQGQRILQALESGHAAVLQRQGDTEQGIQAKLDRILDRLDISPARLFPTVASDTSADAEFEETYCKKATEKLRGFRMFGVREMREYQQDLDIAYITLRLKVEGVEETEGEEDEGEETRTAEVALLRYRQLYIVGLAGSGKTTLLQWLAKTCASSASRPESPWRGGVPFLVPLRSLTEGHHGKPKLAELWEYSFGLGQWTERPPPGWIERLLRAQRGVILLDGVDELPPAMRSNFWDWVLELNRDYPGNRIYVTSRPLMEVKRHEGGAEPRLGHSGPPESFTCVRVDDLSDADLDQFIDKWHEAVKLSVTKDFLLEELRRSRAELPGKLRDSANQQVRQLCRTPLLAGMVCALHWQENGFLPKRKVQLYQRCCQLLAQERDTHRSVPRDDKFKDTDADAILALLGRLAFEMMRNRLPAERGQFIEVSANYAKRWIQEHQSRSKHEGLKTASPEAVLTFFVERVGLLREPAAGMIDFPHRSIQEYLAARAVEPMGQVGYLTGQVANDQWHDTIVLASGVSQRLAEEIVDGLLQMAGRTYNSADRRKAIALAAACAESATEELPPVLNSRLTEALRNIIPPRSAQEADAIAVAGDALVPYLRYSKLRSEQRRVKSVIRACVRALSRIGSRDARTELLDPNGYGSVGDALALAAMCFCPGVELEQIPGFSQRLFSNPSRVSWPDLPLSLRGLVVRLPPIPQPDGIYSVELGGFEELKDISSLSQCKNVYTLALTLAKKLTDLGPLSSMVALRHLVLSRLTSLTSLGPLADLRKLASVELDSCTSLRDLRPLTDWTSLTTLDLIDCSGVTDLGPLTSLTNLGALRLSGCIGITDLGPLSEMNQLRTLYLNGCVGIRDLGPLAGMTKLRNLLLRGCTSVEDLGPLAGLTELIDLDLRGCTRVKDLRSLAGLTHLRHIDLRDGPGERALAPVRHVQRILVESTLLNPWVS